ncbi:MAG: RagB/SusD family nutrient uptake outer membrane protein [Bacteroidota bacterium]
MKKYINIYLGILLVTISSCSDDFVDIDERGAATATTVEDLRLTLDGINGAFVDNNDETLLHYTEMFFTDEITHMSLASYNGIFAQPDRRAYGFEDFIYNEAEADLTWNRYYKVISSANFVLNQVDDLPDALGQRDQVKGEALVYRAFAYLWLVNIYADNYTDATAQNSMGVPIITEFGDPTVSLVRASVDDVYDLIINDLNEATVLLSGSTGSVFKPGAAATYGLLAKAYLQMGKYDLAKENADEALAINNSILDYNTLPIAPVAINFDFVNLSLWSPRPGESENPETIFYFNNQYGLDFASLQGGTFVSLDPNYFPVTSSTSFVSDDVMALGSPFDIRFSRMIFNTNGDNRFLGYGDFRVTRGIPKGINTAELTLIKAESEARTGDFNTAMAILNDFRSKRFFNFVPGAYILTATNPDEAIQHILDERQREFMLRGYRMFDIKRLNAHHNTNISATHVIPTDGSSVTLEANNPKWNAAIPPAEILLAPELIQNPRN